ncbi:UPF0758 domain-containing protein [Acetobacter papayae]|uniref:UPF0758 domain-containing protein n=1 Tax=Acetobacter papayae TaxID=1076592 RepID=UPI0039EC207F
MDNGPPDEQAERRRSGRLTGQGRSGSVFDSTGPQGHRQRMRERVLRHGPAGLADYEIIEMLLFSGVPRRDTKPLAKALINQFGSLSAVLGAPPEALRAAGAPERGAGVFGCVAQLAATAPRAAEAERLMLDSWGSIFLYANSCLALSPPGQVRALFLDSHNNLLADEALPGQPFQDAAEAVATLMRRAVALHACAVLTVHLVRDDTQLDLALAQARPLAVAIGQAAPRLALSAHGHLAVGRAQWLSFSYDGDEA